MAVLAIQTRALVLRAHPLRESDRLVELFTRECGLLRAVGASVREARSKLRFALEPFSLIDVTLVRGRGVWRVRGASAELSLYRSLKDFPDKMRLVASVMRLLGRLVAGEEQNTPLFDTIVDAFTLLPDLPLELEELKAFESILVLRVFSELGYRLPKPQWQRYLTGVLERGLCREFIPDRPAAVKLVNEVLAQTQL